MASITRSAPRPSVMSRTASTDGVLFDIDGERGPEPSGQVQFLTILAQPSNDDLGRAGLSRPMTEVKPR